MIKKILVIFIGVFLVTSVNAKTYKYTGKVTRVLSGTQYGECMIFLSKGAPAPCPTNGWVSLDCEGKYNNKSVGDRSYASAVVAASLGKQATVEVNDEKRHNGYCVAERLDVLF